MQCSVKSYINTKPDFLFCVGGRGNSDYTQLGERFLERKDQQCVSVSVSPKTIQGSIVHLESASYLFVFFTSVLNHLPQPRGVYYAEECHRGEAAWPAGNPMQSKVHKASHV